MVSNWSARLSLRNKLLLPLIFLSVCLLIIAGLDLHGAKLALAVVGSIFVANLLGHSMNSELAASIRELKADVADMEAGKLNWVPKDRGRDELAEVSRNLTSAMARFRTDIQQMAEISARTASGATELAATTEQLSATTVEISSGAEQQRVAVAQSSATLRKVSDSIASVSERVERANTLSKGSLDMAAEGIDNARLCTEAMGAIQESSNKVGRITKVIADIARQTNLLSLNAAIEAAKAGSEGKGCPPRVGWAPA